jgi:hypothetical protein
MSFGWMAYFNMPLPTISLRQVDVPEDVGAGTATKPRIENRNNMHTATQTRAATKNPMIMQPTAPRTQKPPIVSPVVPPSQQEAPQRKVVVAGPETNDGFTVPIQVKGAAVQTNTELSEAEKKKLQSCEKKIASSSECFVEVGESLQAIRDQKLYRESHNTFESYCEQVWGFGRSYAYRQIKAAKIVADLLAENGKETPLPTTEGQARELGRLTKSQRVEAMLNAKALCGDFRMTSAQVQQAVNALKKPKAPTAPKATKIKATLSTPVILTLVAQAKQRINEGADTADIVEILTKIETTLGNVTQELVQAAA